MKKIGLYFGTFNPIHVGHLIIANHLANHSDLDQIWFVVSPHNPLKDKNTLLDDHHRLTMVRLAIQDNPKLQASNIEFELPKPSYTILTLQALREKHSGMEFSLIMGEDNLRSIHKWKNYEYILENFNILVYPRVQPIDSTDNFDASTFKRVKRCSAPAMNISSTLIRELIKNKKDARYLLTEPVWKYIDEMNFYR